MIIEYKNHWYVQPAVPAGDGGHMIRIPFSAPGVITDVKVTKMEGKGCGWTHECPDGAKCPYPYKNPVDYNQPRDAHAYWNAWSNSGEDCAIFFSVAFK
jgi:hypothetical protein